MEKKPESKRERVVRLAEARTNKIIDMIQLLGNCANANTMSILSRMSIRFSLHRSRTSRSKEKIPEGRKQQNIQVHLKIRRVLFNGSILSSQIRLEFSF